jgi:hypothetical protein
LPNFTQISYCCLCDTLRTICMYTMMSWGMRMNLCMFVSLWTDSYKCRCHSRWHCRWAFWGWYLSQQCVLYLCVNVHEISELRVQYSGVCRAIHITTQSAGWRAIYKYYMKLLCIPFNLILLLVHCNWSNSCILNCWFYDCHSISLDWFWYFSTLICNVPIRFILSPWKWPRA